MVRKIANRNPIGTSNIWAIGHLGLWSLHSPYVSGRESGSYPELRALATGQVGLEGGMRLGGQQPGVKGSCTLLKANIALGRHSNMLSILLVLTLNGKLEPFASVKLPTTLLH